MITKNNTTVANLGRETIVTLHSTPIVIFNPKRIILTTGGYKTKTTKKRMNEVAKEFNLGYNVFQHRKQWYLCAGTVCVSFHDGMTILRG